MTGHSLVKWVLNEGFPLLTTRIGPGFIFLTSFDWNPGSRLPCSYPYLENRYLEAWQMDSSHATTYPSGGSA